MAPFILFLGRSAFARVKADASGVQIRNVWSTRFFEWPIIDRFELGVQHASFFQLAAAIHLVDGREITIFAIQQPNRNMWSKKPDLSAQRAVDELNRLLAEARADASSRTLGAE